MPKLRRHSVVRPASLSLEASAVPFTDEVDFVPFEPTHLKVAGIVQKRKARPRDPRRRRTRLWQEKFSAMLSWMFELIRRRDERRKQRVTEPTTSATHNPERRRKSCQDTLSSFTASSVRRQKKYIGRFSMETPCVNGFRRTGSPGKFTTWMPRSAAPTRCRSRTSAPARVTPSAASTSNWCQTNASVTRTDSTTRTCPEKCRRQ